MAGGAGGQGQEGEAQPAHGERMAADPAHDAASGGRGPGSGVRPHEGIRPLDTSTWHTYTEEEPNSLTVDEVPRFMAKGRELVPPERTAIP